MNFEAQNNPNFSKSNESPDAERISIFEKMHKYIAVPAFVAMLSACSEKPSDIEIEAALGQTKLVEKIPAEQIATLKNNLEILIKENPDTDLKVIRSNDGHIHIVYFPSRELLVINKQVPDSKEWTDMIDHSYSFQPDGTVVFSLGFDLESENQKYIDSKTIISDSSVGPIISYSIIYDFGPKRTYKIGNDFNEAISPDIVTRYILEDNDLLAIKNN